MKPLQPIAMGLVIIVLSARFRGYDALADPVGWLLVAVGVAALPARIPHRGTLLRLAALAGAVSALVWFPAVTDALYDADPSLAWAANLPQVMFTAVLCHSLAGAAAEARDARASRWLRSARTAVVVVGLLPVLVFGAGLAAYEVATYLAAGLVAVLVTGLLFAYGSRPWARPDPAPDLWERQQGPPLPEEERPL
jgi:hypothetical protein